MNFKPSVLFHCRYYAVYMHDLVNMEVTDSVDMHVRKLSNTGKNFARTFLDCLPFRNWSVGFRSAMRQLQAPVRRKHSTFHISFQMTSFVIAFQ